MTICFRLKKSRIHAVTALISLTFPILGLCAQTVRIEGNPDAKWQNFYSQLQKLESGKADQALHILQIGDSHTAGDYLSGRLRERFKSRYGDSGIGLLPPGIVKNLRVSQVKIPQSAQWQTTRERNITENGGNPGLGGYAGSGSAPYQTVSYDLTDAADYGNVTVYSRHSAGSPANFKLYQDGEEISPKRSENEEPAASPTEQRTRFELSKPGRSISILSPGRAKDFQLLGINWFSSRPGVVFSNIGITGAQLGVVQEWDSAFTRGQLNDLAPALLILEFGTNDAFDRLYSPEQFKDTLERTADWVNRNLPDAPVLLLLPPDALVRRGNCSANPQYIGKGKARRLVPPKPAICFANGVPENKCGLQSHPNLDPVRQLMRQVAASNHWRTWDWSALTGRQCGARIWQSQGESLYRPDGVHLTREGYELSGDVLFKALTVSR